MSDETIVLIIMLSNHLRMAIPPMLPRNYNIQLFLIWHPPSQGVLGNETEIDVPGISGEPFPTITWTFNGAGISLGDR